MKHLFFLAAVTISTFFTLPGCSNDRNRNTAPSRADSLMNVINQARSAAEKGTSIMSREKIDSLSALSEEELAAQIGTAGTVPPPAEKGSPTSMKTSSTDSPASKTFSPSDTVMKMVLTDKDTAGSVESALSRNAAMVMVDSGSAEDKRLDSLMAIAGDLEAGYRAYVLTHTHKNLAMQAHQDPAKQRRLLLAIDAARERRAAAEAKATEARRKRLEAHLKPVAQVDTMQ